MIQACTKATCLRMPDSFEEKIKSKSKKKKKYRKGMPSLFVHFEFYIACEGSQKVRPHIRSNCRCILCWLMLNRKQGSTPTCPFPLLP